MGNLGWELFNEQSGELSKAKNKIKSLEEEIKRLKQEIKNLKKDNQFSKISTLERELKNAKDSSLNYMNGSGGSHGW